MIHVVPVEDAITHELTERCVCGPDVERTEGWTGQVAHFIRHHALLTPAEAG